MESLLYSLLNRFLFLTQMPAPQTDPKAALLAQLDPYITPEPISIWPLAIGWWIVIALTIALVVFTVILFKNKKAKNVYRHLALAQFKHIKTFVANSASNEVLLNELTNLTKQIYPYIHTQLLQKRQLTGGHWWLHINQFLPDSNKHQLFLSSFPFDALYSPSITVTSEQKTQLLDYTQHWMSKHHIKYYQKNAQILNTQEAKHV